MRLMDDYFQPTPHDGRCRVRTYLSGDDGDAPVELLTGLSPTPGQSVTNAAETIARQAITTHCFDEPEPVFIEHYEDGGRGSSTDSHTFDLVRFKTYTLIESSGSHAPPWSIGTPTWKPLDRATVETLVGESIARFSYVSYEQRRDPNVARGLHRRRRCPRSVLVSGLRPSPSTGLL